ncbi:MAG: 6-bladed beta-propeller [Candidatus Eisenbacteria bacterium]|uniref:6-bladed beta-propeller n=1 Tax=Eiseniibacteriota bacterium TaxID=2212470 RepID=A0A956LVX1_UNCEI|nr:6-bladed beta-propeller [Candidatus Eisenbacteria bacterium]
MFGQSSDCAFGMVADVAVDDGGSVYVLDKGFDVIHVFDATGEFLYDVGRKGEGPGEFWGPLCLDVGPDGRIYVAGKSGVISVLLPDGRAAGFIDRSNHELVRSIRVTSTGRVYTTSLDVFKETVIDEYTGDLGDGTYVRSFGEAYGRGKNVDPRTELVFGGGFLDLARDDTMYYVQMTPQLVRVDGQAGDLLRTHRARFDELGAPAEPDYTEGSVEYMVGPMANAIVCLGDLGFLTVLGYPQKGPGDPGENVVDLYGEDGRLKCSSRLPGRFGVKCADARERIYVVEDRDDDEVVVRYDLAMNDLGAVIR